MSGPSSLMEREVIVKMTKLKKEDAKGATAPLAPLKPCEVRTTFWVRSPQGQDHLFSVTGALLNGKLDLSVSFSASDDEVQYLPAWLIEQVQVGIELVRKELRPEALVERDD